MWYTDQMNPPCFIIALKVKPQTELPPFHALGNAQGSCELPKLWGGVAKRFQRVFLTSMPVTANSQSICLGELGFFNPYVAKCCVSWKGILVLYHSLASF